MSANTLKARLRIARELGGLRQLAVTSVRVVRAGKLKVTDDVRIRDTKDTGRIESIYRAGGSGPLAASVRLHGHPNASMRNELLRDLRKLNEEA